MGGAGRGEQLVPGAPPVGQGGKPLPARSAWPPIPSPRTDTWLLDLRIFLSAAHLAPSEPVTFTVPVSLCPSFSRLGPGTPLEGFASFECHGLFLKLRETKQYD